MKKLLDRITSGQTLWPGIVLILAGVVILFPGAVFHGDAIAPGDLQLFYYPWCAEFSLPDSGPSNWILFDEILEFYPWREYLRSNLLQGIVPLWDSTAFCGYPFQGLFQTSLLYIPDRLLETLPFNYYSLFRSLFHLLVAGLGIGLLLRQLKFRTPALTFGMCAYAFSGFMIVWLGHPHCKVAAWLPWLFYGIERLVHRKPHAYFIALTSIVMTIVAGHIETALHTLSVALAYGVFHFLRLRKKQIYHLTAKYLVAIIVGVLLSGAMILPFAEYLSRSVAYNTRADGVITQGWLDPITSVSMLLPEAFGHVARATYWYPGFNTAELGGAFAGSITLVFALAGIIIGFRNWHVKVYGLIAVVSGCVAFGIPPIYQIVSILPGYKMSYNFRMVLPMVFCSIILAAFFIDRLLCLTWKKAQTSLVSSFLFFLVITGMGIWYLKAQYAADLTVNLNHQFAQFAGVCVFFCIVIPFLANKFNKSILLILPFAVTFELMIFGLGFNTTCRIDDLEALPLSTRTLSQDSASEPFRTLPIGKTYPPHSCLRFNMHDLRGNDALTPLVTEDYIALFETEMRAPHQLPALRMMWLSQWDSPLVDALNVKFITFPVDKLSKVPHRLIPFKTQGGVHIFENPDAFDRAFIVNHWINLDSYEAVINNLRSHSTNLKQTALLSTKKTFPEPQERISNNQVKRIHHSPHKIHIETKCETPGLLVLSDTFFPGWKVWINSERTEIYQVNGMMRGVFLPAGELHVDFKYEPVSFRFGLYLTLLGTFFAAFTAIVLKM